MLCVSMNRNIVSSVVCSFGSFSIVSSGWWVVVLGVDSVGSVSCVYISSVMLISDIILNV